MNHLQCGNRSVPRSRCTSSQIEWSPQLYQGQIKNLINKTMTQKMIFPFFWALSCTNYQQWPGPSKYPRMAHARHQRLSPWLATHGEPTRLSSRHFCIDCISLRVECINSLLFVWLLVGGVDWQVSVGENPSVDSFYSRIPGIGWTPKNPWVERH